MRTQRIARIGVVGLLCALSAAACGDDGANGAADAAVIDASPPGVDAAVDDAAVVDAALVDAAVIDAALVDAALPDAALPDAALVDALIVDAGPADADPCAGGPTTHNLDWFLGISNAAASLTICAGDTVTWTWTDGAPHSVTSDGSAFDSGTLTGSGMTFSHTFSAAGSFPYHCSIHSSMTGTITVQ